ncbi:hypothetical protein Zmor_007608 [Zophobas morio]|uniref:7tm 6 domain containing protein n=1 Tax=Zophobas morio TaxID=2755281 RepID=A0AA38IZX8_9CUCU|nr:hypothetical protein Zmor_007608 [Zophobas morio]
MEKFSWNQTIKINILMLQSVGLWPKGDEMYKRDLYALYAIISTIVIMGGHNFFQVMNVFFVYKNLEALTGTIFITVTDVLASIKMYFFIQNIGVIKQLMITLNSRLFQPKNSAQIDLVRPGLNSWKFMYVTFWIMTSTTVFTYSIFPFLDNSVKEKNLPFVAWYPYNAKISPLYEITYLYQVLGIWYLTVANINMDTMIAGLMMYVQTQCDILCDNLRNLGSFTQTELNEGYTFNHKIIICVKHHRLMVHFAENCNRFFNMIVLGQFCTSTVVIALTMFQLTLVDPLSSASLSHLSYVTAITVQLFLYCWFGNEVEIKVRDLSFSNSSRVKK